MAIHYICNSCHKRIFPVSARFHCLVCTDHDTCQACHLSARFTAPHEGAHPFHVIYDPTTSPPPTAALTTLAIAPPQPPPLPPRQLSSTSSSHHTPHSPATSSPHSPHPWGPLTTPQHTPTTHLLRLADAAFTHFSTPAPTRTLTPEQLATFYTAMGRSGSTNFPSLFHTLMAHYGATLDPSDTQIAFVFQEYAYPFLTATRAGSSVVNGMPLLLLEGFRRMLLDEILEAPENAWVGFNTLLAAVGAAVGVGSGPIPRGCFPEREDAGARARGDRISGVLVERSRVMFERLEREREEREGEREREAGETPAVKELKRRQAEVEAEAAAQARAAIEQRGQEACVGGWRTDSWGNEYYHEGLI
ncbi:uncharacterized protein H6S33_008792 [Morchella sextelata]|uniref:uncharacterized protein n=1 Tax=Morchella sextelata TaxID=1174677 RepID=UPI001D04F985|nr:uncharacterized protein H6S33_008792 [Morchella sextelata]KAH0602453.1 hypothetical protein H6S33_008792 [Morchella sextelata]